MANIGPAVCLSGHGAWVDLANLSTASPALQSEAETTVYFPDDWFDPIEALRDRVREFIQADLEAELNLRQIDPPFDAVRADMERLKTAAIQV